MADADLGTRPLRAVKTLAWSLALLAAALGQLVLAALPAAATSSRVPSQVVVLPTPTATTALVTGYDASLNPAPGACTDHAAGEVDDRPSADLMGLSNASAGVPSAPRAADEFVDLSTSARRNHILHGDATGGGHLYPGLAGKSPFPQSWSGDRILHEVSDIATDPTAWRNAIGQGNRTVLTGTRGGVDIRVIVDTRTGQIISGYPTNIPRNPR